MSLRPKQGQPPIPLLSSKVLLAGAATSIIFVTTNMCLLWQNTSFVMTKVCLLQQNFCHNKIMFVVTIFFLLQQDFCHDKHTFVMTKDVFCRDKSKLVTTKLCMSRQIFVATIFLLQQKCLSWQKFCCDKHTFVATKHIFCRKKLYLWQLRPMLQNMITSVAITKGPQANMPNNLPSCDLQTWTRRSRE